MGKFDMKIMATALILVPAGIVVGLGLALIVLSAGRLFL